MLLQVAAANIAQVSASDGPSPALRWKSRGESSQSTVRPAAAISTSKQGTKLQWRAVRPARGAASAISTHTANRNVTPTAAYQDDELQPPPRRDPFELDNPQPSRQLPEGTPPETRRPAVDPFDLQPRTNPIRPNPTTQDPTTPTDPRPTTEPPRTLEPTPTQPQRNPFPDDPTTSDPEPMPRQPMATDDPYYSHTQEDCDEAAQLLRNNTLVSWDKARLDISISGTEGDDFPLECRFAEQQFVPRHWHPTDFFWTASSLCHKPLYFEDVQLERYGHETGPFTQPFASAAHFFVTLPILPYKMGLRTPNECVYALGYYRPGNCAPYMIEPLGFTWRAALFEAGAWVGGAAAIP